MSALTFSNIRLVVTLIVLAASIWNCWLSWVQLRDIERERRGR